MKTNHFNLLKTPGVISLIRLMILITIFPFTLSIHAQDPPPPPGQHGNNSNHPPGGGAPVGDGLITLIALGAAWGLIKKVKTKKNAGLTINNNEEPIQ